MLIASMRTACASCGFPAAKIRSYEWGAKAKRRKTTGTGRMRTLKVCYPQSALLHVDTECARTACRTESQQRIQRGHEGDEEVEAGCLRVDKLSTWLDERCDGASSDGHLVDGAYSQIYATGAFALASNALRKSSVL